VDRIDRSHFVLTFNVGCSLFWKTLLCIAIVLPISSPVFGAEPSSEAATWLQNGNDLLSRNEADSAEAAFNKAMKAGAKARGLNGLGLVMVAKGKSYHRQAFKFYRRALGADKTFIEAQLNIGRLHAQRRDRDTQGAYKKAIKMAPDRSESYIELANFITDTEGIDAGPEVAELLAAYIEREPTDPSGYVIWMESLADRAMVREIRDVSSILLERFPEEAGFLPALAQAEAAAGQVDVATDHWRRFLGSAPVDTRTVYDDLSRVAAPDDVALYTATAEADREAFLVRFWRARDASSGLGGNGARSEHYRRVWYSIRNFSKGQQPWDKRGDVYVRYGEPDYRSRSGYPNQPPSGAAELVRDRLFSDIGIKPPSISETANVEGFSSRDFFENSTGLEQLADAPQVEPIYPIFGVGPRRWESWIYTRIGGGIEFVFVDWSLNGNFKFPLPPDDPDIPPAILAKLTEFHPGRVYESVSLEEPQHYDFPFGFSPLEFYYDLATFRGSAGRTRLEVYYGLLTGLLETGKMKDGRTIHAVERTLTLKGGGAEGFRKNDVGAYEATEGSPSRTLLEVATLEVPPGDYRLNVEALDRASGKWGIYSQDVSIPEIPDTLSMSDLHLAWSVSPTKTDDRFRKHIDGLDPETDVWVIPLPSRSFRKGNPFNLYYEIYNLALNEFGQTSYEVRYTVDQQIRKGEGVFGALGSIFKRAMTDREPQVSIGYEATGDSVDEPVYLEIETKEMKPGYNRLTVLVTDQVSGRVVKREGILRLVDR
jgi:GWxTD domain-containing protein